MRGRRTTRLSNRFLESVWIGVAVGAALAVFVSVTLVLASPNGIVAAMEEHQGVAAWVQAVGSVLAILISAVFAIWVPLRMKMLEDRGAAQRVQMDCIFAASTMHSNWETLEIILAKRDFHSNTGLLFNEKIATVRSIASKIPTSLLTPDALIYLNRCTMSAQTLDMAIKSVMSSADPYSVVIPFTELKAWVFEAVVAFDNMEPIKLAEAWVIGRSLEKAS